MTYEVENNSEQYNEKPSNGCRGLFFAALFTLIIAIIVVGVILLSRC